MAFIDWPCLLRQSLAEGVVAAETYKADGVVETLDDDLGLLKAYL
jgi:hypothetical protein